MRQPNNISYRKLNEATRRCLRRIFTFLPVFSDFFVVKASPDAHYIKETKVVQIEKID
jgi:hypothetical protein